MSISEVKSQQLPWISSPRVQFGVYTTLFGMFIFTLGAKPEWFGLDRSPVVGFVQIAVFLVGLGTICRSLAIKRRHR